MFSNWNDKENKNKEDLSWAEHINQMAQKFQIQIISVIEILL